MRCKGHTCLILGHFSKYELPEIIVNHSNSSFVLEMLLPPCTSELEI